MALEMCGRQTASSSRIYTKHGGTAVTNGVNIMAASYTPPRCDGILRITVCLTTASKLYLTCTDGTDAYTDSVLNDDVALKAATWYLFEIPISATEEGYNDDTTGTALLYNLQLGTTSVVRDLYVSYVTGPLV